MMVKDKTLPVELHRFGFIASCSKAIFITLCRARIKIEHGGVCVNICVLGNHSTNPLIPHSTSDPQNNRTCMKIKKNEILFSLTEMLHLDYGAWRLAQIMEMPYQSLVAHHVSTTTLPHTCWQDSIVIHYGCVTPIA